MAREAWRLRHELWEMKYEQHNFVNTFQVNFLHGLFVLVKETYMALTNGEL